MNLAVNARDAMPRGGKLTVELKNLHIDGETAFDHSGIAPGDYVLLAISDTGTGMDKAVQARIFEPFFSTKEHGKGTGLGLSTVFGIVQQSKGHIGVYSEVGIGSTFKVYFPRVDAMPDAQSASLPPQRLAGTETILLVEDDDQLRTIAREILRKQGYRVLEARDATEAIFHVERRDGVIDLLVTDVVMPQMSGPDLAARLVQLLPGLKVLFMSGYTDDALIRHGVLGTGFAYLQKPLTPDKLAGKVRSVLDARAP